MKVVFIKNYKHKLLILAGAIIIWAIMLILTGSLSENRLMMNITINSFISFSHPMDFEIENIYISESLGVKAAETCFPVKSPRSYNYKIFKSTEGKFAFSYPSAFTLKPEDFPGTEILYHVDFHDKEGIVHGFVQVWKLSDTLENFLKKSRENSTLEFNYFNETPVTVKGLSGYIWDYSVKNGTENNKGMEAFLSKGESMYRISYFLPERNMNEEHKKTFLEMVKSFKILD